MVFQTLFDSVRITTTNDVISVVLSQIISVAVVHGDCVCRIAAAVRRYACCQIRNQLVRFPFSNITHILKN